MRKIIAYIATSSDGFIARRKGEVDWLDRPRPRGNYGMDAFYRSIDTVIMGRKTWDLARSFGQPAYPGKQNYVFSRRPRNHKDVVFVQKSAAAFARGLRRTKGKDVWLVGEGIPLLQPRRRTVRLKLVASRSHPDGVVRLHYVVRRKTRRE